jgi:hypothetical protein
MEEKLNSLSVTLKNYVVASIVLLVGFAVALVVEARTGWLHVSATGQTYGKIYVDQPEVLSRERLVHDRAVQDEWLRALLGSAGFDPARPAPPTVSAARPGAEVKADDAKATPAGSAEPPESPPAAAPVDATEARPDRVTEFHDQLAFRNEVRAELIDNLLDDGKGPAGNTLYLLKFDTTVVPEERTSAFGVVRVDVGSSYGKALEGGTEQLADEAAFDSLAKLLLARPEAERAALAELHALFVRGLSSLAEGIDGEQARGRRLIQDALRSNTAAEDDTPWLGGVKPDSSPEEQWSDASLERLDQSDLYAFADYLGSAPATSDAARGCPEGQDVQVALGRIGCVLDKLTTGRVLLGSLPERYRCFAFRRARAVRHAARERRAHFRRRTRSRKRECRDADLVRRSAASRTRQPKDAPSRASIRG